MSKLAKILVIPVRRPASVDGRPPVDPALRDIRARWLLVVMAAAGVALFAWGAFMSTRQETASIRKLAQESRHTLYLRTLEEVETICRDPAAAAGALHEHCVSQARFLVELPECGDGCRRSAEVILPHAHR
jgi:hypothetical protein